MASDLPVPAQTVAADRAAEFRALRNAVRSALSTTRDGKPVPPSARRALNDIVAACPRSV